ncbi:GNAT family N-acetyltransferase [Litchfieldia alkalitelluris]|uniref:GNAT family N-acetyltransferase n=1 Tax=Litchfieldia alkalitelluris TaxID=304268 RepID=UPI00099688AC|nr:GNAT family N-acetyltransferase [Litchfieldia alkalitelluris]
MEVIKLAEQYYKEAIKLSEYAFQYKVSEEKITERIETLNKYHQLFGIVEQEELIAKLHLIPFEIYIGQIKFKMGGIAGVATYPEHRRNGNVKEMLIHSLKVMKAQGQTISMLHPFSIPFYRKYGWEVLSNRIKITMTKNDLYMLGETKGYVKRYVQENQFNDLQNTYEEFATRFSGMLVRHNEWWKKNVIDDLKGAIYYDVLNSPKGYLLYSIKNSKMEIEEFIALDGEAKKGLWNFICQHDSMINELVITTYDNDPFFFSINNPMIKTELSPYFMVRIVDVISFLQQYQFDWPMMGIEQSVILKVTDNFANWNEGFFKVSNEKVIHEINANKEDVINLSINALSAMLLGYKRPKELFELGIIQCKEKEMIKLESLIPKNKPFFNDFF